ncbi:MAG: hypothetical protein RLZZ417_3236 [Bacteroidota bacterium]
MFNSFTIIYIMYKVFLSSWMFFCLISFRGEISMLLKKNQDAYFTIDMTNDFVEDTKESEETETELKKTGFSIKDQHQTLVGNVKSSGNFSQIKMYISNHIIPLFIPPPNK